MTQKELLNRRLGLKIEESMLIQEEINFIQDAIASIPHEPTPQEREEFFKSEIDETTCKKCGGEMAPGQALVNTPFGIPDFEGTDGMLATMSMTGPPDMVPCLKCRDCGWSITSDGGVQA